MRMGVVADDLTGANDIGSMFAKVGLVTDVFTFDSPDDFVASSADICILDTNSRLDDPQTLYAKNFAATQALQDARCKQFFSKTSSAFVGNVGVQFDAMLDALKEEFAIVVVGFPKNGRTTIDGIHYVHGKKLEESEFRNDPIHPMTCSNLVEILQSQTRRRVGLISHQVIARGPEALKACIQEHKARCNYLVLDVVDQNALATIAQAVYDQPVLCGSSALAEELPALWKTAPSAQAHKSGVAPQNGLGVLFVAGSLMPQTIGQIEYLHATGAATFELNTQALFDKPARYLEVVRLTFALTCRLRHGQNVIVHSPNCAATVERTRREGAKHGLSRTQVSRLVAETLAEVASNVRGRSGLNRLVVAGGETSAAVCARLGARRFRVWKEIQPGLPSCITLSDSPLLLVLKSGSFGGPDFIQRAIEHLKQEEN